MVSRDLVVDILSDDMALLRKKREENVHSVGLEGMYLMVTDKCNLQCKYCFIEHGMPTDYRHSMMSWEVARKAVDMYFSNLAKNPPLFRQSLKLISLYGGEPLLNFPVIKKVIEYTLEAYKKQVEEMEDKFLFSLVTNGTLITKDIAKFLAKYPNVSVTVSIDGEKNVHDEKRVYPDGRGSFDNTIRGCRLLKKEGCENFSLSCTIDDHNIEELNSLLRLHQEYGFISINLNPLLDTEEKKVSAEYMEKASATMLEYFKLAREEGVYEERIMRKMKAFVFRKIRAFDCQATGNQIVCSPDGKLGVCHEGVGVKRFFFGRVSPNFDFHNNPTINEWNQRSPLNMPQCYDCAAIAICGGGCAYGAQLRNGSIWSVDDRFCIHSKKTLEWLIWDLQKILP